jgi:hypothetical protein
MYGDRLSPEVLDGLILSTNGGDGGKGGHTLGKDLKGGKGGNGGRAGSYQRIDLCKEMILLTKESGNISYLFGSTAMSVAVALDECRNKPWSAVSSITSEQVLPTLLELESQGFSSLVPTEFENVILRYQDYNKVPMI